jgi:hypothetical protein
MTSLFSWLPPAQLILIVYHHLPGSKHLSADKACEQYQLKYTTKKGVEIYPALLLY